VLRQRPREVARRMDGVVVDILEVGRECLLVRNMVEMNGCSLC